jgi:hypothetical protein
MIARENTSSPRGIRGLASFTSSAMTENEKALAAMYSTPRESFTLEA